MTSDNQVTVIGAGSWGTALAIQLARAGTSVTLWGRDHAAVVEMQRERVNARYLPDAPFPKKLTVQPDWDAALAGSCRVLISVPSHAFRMIVKRLGETWQTAGVDFAACELAWATKGFELDTGMLPHEVVGDELPQLQHYAVVSGPTFAKEVGIGLPTALTIAGSTKSWSERFAQQIGTPEFRAYLSDDIIGVEVGGAVKNPLAIGAGMSDGLGFGANARTAFITRGLLEMTRLGTAMGARSETFMGLAGMGDLVLTCTDNQSRNRRMGLALAAGQTSSDAEAEIGQVVEGLGAARAVYAKSQALGLDLAIIKQIYRVIADGVDPRVAVEELLSRDVGDELRSLG